MLSCAIIWLLALVEHTESQVWDPPSGICAPSCGGQLSALMEHTIKTRAEWFWCLATERIGDRLVTRAEYTECWAESCRVVPVARLVLPATLMGRTLNF